MADAVTAATTMELEELAYRAWPAAEVWELDGWRVRFTSGVTRRANSVWPNRSASGRPLEERIARVEGFYAERAVPARFQVGPAAVPTELDAALAGRGYRVEAPVSLQAAELRQVLQRLGQPESALDAEVSRTWEGDFFALTADRGRFAAVQEVYRGILERVQERAGFALVCDAGEAIGAALGVVEGEWLGIFSMHTLAEHRRRGAGRAALRALCGWALGEGARRAYLQVERDGAAALGLYAGAGFREVYGYHYRVRDV